MKNRLSIPLAMFLTLVPVTLLVPGLTELVQVAHGGTRSDAHAFMSVNMLAGMLSVPAALRLLRKWPDVRLWLCGALLIDALAFVGMGLAPSLPALYAFRALDGLVHLPAVTLLMVASNRLSGEGRGGSLGALAGALMIGVAIGSPLGGVLVERGPWLVYAAGAVFLLLAAVTCLSIGRIPAPEHASAGRYEWNRASAFTWVPLGYGFLDRFSIGIFVSTFTLFLGEAHGLSATQRGVLIALFMLPFALLCYPAGRLADRRGWFAPMLLGNLGFGIVFASYGVVSKSMLPVAMLASGVFSALMLAPNLLLISDLVRRGYGEGLFGAFQVAGSMGFLVGPIVGGILVSVTRNADGRPAYEWIFAGVGLLEFAMAAISYSLLRSIARELRQPVASLAPVAR
ncbi:MAG: MFS transporter [Gemmatimonadaceae bacterium]